MTEDISSCASLGIPTYLHRNSREPDQNFDNKNERLFRRIEDPDHINNGNIRPAALTTRNQSVNREKHSRNPTDVLYNINSKQHFNKHGICSFSVADVEDICISHPDLDIVYTLGLEHDPEECMYPHTIIEVLTTNPPPKRIAPTVKTKLKADLARKAHLDKDVDKETKL